MNQIAICHNWTSKSSERNSETLELWGLYFMSQSTQDSELRKSQLFCHVRWLFRCDFQRSPQNFYFCHSPSRGVWERDRVELTKIQSVGDWVSVSQLGDWWMAEWITNDFICLRSDQFQLAVQSRNKSSVPFVGCSLSIVLHSRHCILFVWWILISSQKLVV